MLVFRTICSALVAAPLAYWLLVTNGDAYHFLAMVLLAPLAGFLLIINSLWRLILRPGRDTIIHSIGFILVGIVGFWVPWYFLQQFRM